MSRSQFSESRLRESYLGPCQVFWVVLLLLVFNHFFQTQLCLSASLGVQGCGGGMVHTTRVKNHQWFGQFPPVEIYRCQGVRGL